ncbi:MAG: RagB/SusD family nutrient uptake outer membrane protein [Bacteroidales bacterium]|nr:RagB/SusD family nutrient uptake outer membrane protein [Bacteroidales bacterium]MBN2698874.1 RagB/SusD family nutrient uptake outer membrane protein [Bacteroidales bacterium]
MKKKIISSKSLIAIIITAGFILTSCEEYLDKAPEAEISEEEVFSTFLSFQGFTEELYHCIPDYTRSTWCADWNIADEIVATLVDWRLNVHFDNGDYWYWYTTACGWNQSYFNACSGAQTSSGTWDQKGIWPLSWYGIRKANVGLANLDKLVDATDEEKRIIEGQLLFFRGFFHFQLMSFWGGMPYIDEVLGSDKLDLPRLSYMDCALRAAEDLATAATLLPVDWDDTEPGRTTSGHNNQRITKSVAYAYLGKNLLYAASPLMNKVSTGSATFDEELCKQAAEALYECLYLSHTGEAPYQLIEWERYHENFFTLNQTIPGNPEALLSPPFFWNGLYDMQDCLWIPQLVGGDGNMISPTHSYIKNFGMANGLPLDAAGSGYDPADPWSNRDPRFYTSIVHDGVQVVQGGTAADDDKRYANLYNDGNYRNDLNGSRTGYLLQKFNPLTTNNIDNISGLTLPSYLRLADVYLMYAEAVLHGYGTPQSSVPAKGGYTLTAEDAINTVRARANVPGVDARYLSSKEEFMSEIIRERAVELMCEANIRFCDLRRWMIAGEKEYIEKTAINFDRDVDGKPINMEEEILVTRVFEDKHYWLPLPTDQVNIYPEFYQNPGW